MTQQKTFWAPLKSNKSRAHLWRRGRIMPEYASSSCGLVRRVDNLENGKWPDSMRCRNCERALAA